jgi:hypothetical protein
MLRSIMLGAVLVLHGLIHVLGFVVYWRLAGVEEISYRTSLLSGYLPVGELGAWVFGLLWLLGALGFAVAGMAVLLSRPWWRQFTLGAALFSLVVTTLGLPDSPYGVVVNLAILAYLFVGEGMRWFPGRGAEAG